MLLSYWCCKVANKSGEREGKKIQSLKFLNGTPTALLRRQAWRPGLLREHRELRELRAADPVLEQSVVVQQPAAGTVLRQLRLGGLPRRPARPQAQGHVQRLREGALGPQQGQTRHSGGSARRIHRYFRNLQKAKLVLSTLCGCTRESEPCETLSLS